jgi:hypothetical protein
MHRLTLSRYKSHLAQKVLMLRCEMLTATGHRQRSCAFRCRIGGVMYGLRADRSLCVDSVGLLRHCWRCGLAGRGAIESLALAGGKPTGKNCACAITKNPAKKSLRAREGGWQIAEGSYSVTGHPGAKALLRNGKVATKGCPMLLAALPAKPGYGPNLQALVKGAPFRRRTTFASTPRPASIRA